MKYLFTVFLSAVIAFCIHSGQLWAQPNTPTAGEIVTDILGFEMVYVPSGTVQMGIDADQFREMITTGIFSEYSGPRSFSIDESYGVFETYETTLHGFWIDRYEMTVNQYERIVHQCLSTDTCSNSNLPQLLRWDEAVRFCAARGARLPTESEWEYTASGPENFIFPWGNEFDTDMFENPDYLAYEHYDVGSRSRNVSWIGIFDMAGNADEWTDDLFQPYYSWDKTALTDWYIPWTEFSRVRRGGDSIDSIWRKTTYSRQAGFFGTAGVRCARFSHPQRN